MADSSLHLNRLKRHFHDCQQSYDEISLLDLAHSLRIWTELKNSKSLAKKSFFKKGILTKPIKRTFRKSEYIYTYLPNGIRSYAAITGGNIFYGPASKDEPFSISGLVKISEDNKTAEAAQLYYIKRCLLEFEIKDLDKVSKKIPHINIDFPEFLASPAIYFRLNNVEPSHITFEELIKRVANEYDASHARSSNEGEFANGYTEPVRQFMSFGCLGLPLPYFVLLYAAGQIIEKFDS